MINKKNFLETYKILIFFKLFPFIFPEYQQELMNYIIEKFINLSDCNLSLFFDFIFYQKLVWLQFNKLCRFI